MIECIFENNVPAPKKESDFEDVWEHVRKIWYTERYGIMVLDGTQWELCLSFNDGQPDVKFHGSNAYPYNFVKLQELFDDLWLEGFEE